MTKSATALILPFPAHRTRLGLRQKLTLASDLIRKAEDAGNWVQDESGITASFLADQIPAAHALHDLSDLEVSQIAIRTALLALHAIHHGSWTDTDMLAFFMRLQAAGRAIEISHDEGCDIRRMAI